MSNNLRTGVFGLWLATMSATGHAQTELCAPFEHAVVDPTMIERMIASAKDGHLYRIRPASSQVGFCVDSPVGTVKGHFEAFNGGLTFAADTAGSEAMVLVDTKSLKTGTGLVEDILKGELFFDVDRFPDILFVSKQFHWINDSEARLVGDLTLRDVTREVDFHVELIEERPNEPQETDDSILVKATTLISRGQFGLDAFSPVVNDTVSLCMQVEAVRYRQDVNDDV